ncbi:MAG TPA: hypothetical protein EYG73_13685 [Arcobacter sp.]|nr:hypothetical protein [Arcobacter sp.]
MQMIVSLIRLQKDKVKDNKLQDLLVTIQNRISAMSHLHELLFKQENATHIDTYEYFDLMIDGIRDSYHHDLKIELNIKAKLKMEEAIYCGLILNELITNSFKYAFPEKNGTIEVSLKKERMLLKILIEAKGSIVPFKYLESLIWSDNFISDSTLRTLLYRLRAKVEYRLIETIPTIGCRLTPAL